jgi:hypothetical protein
MEILGIIAGLSALFIALYFIGKASLFVINQTNSIAVPASLKLAEKLSTKTPKTPKTINIPN